MQLLKKLWKMWGNADILNLLQEKEEETIWCQNQVIMLQSFSQKIYQRQNTYECLGLSILKLSEILMYEFWYDQIKPKQGEKAKFCYMDTYSYMDTYNFIVYIKTEDFYKEIAEDIATRFDWVKSKNFQLLNRLRQ